MVDQVLNFEVVTYQVLLSRDVPTGHPSTASSATIVCIGANSERHTIHFLPAGSDFPKNDYHPVSKHGHTYLPDSQFPWYLDILRNEKPVFSYLSFGYPQANRVYTGNEPVGEGETRFQVVPVSNSSLLNARAIDQRNRANGK